MKHTEAMGEITVAMVDGVKVVVPDDLKLITPYVLQEQGDWFEDEIRLVRKLAGPGFRALDIGANFGVYALSMARSAGPDGRVWAVEPAADVLGCLARSIAANGFTNVELLPFALSRTEGSGTLGGAASPELRRLQAAPAGGQRVDVRTLDHMAAEHGIERVDFVKIDAEGEEVNVLEGGAQFFARESPLVMLELKTEAAVDTNVMAPLARMGYACYRLLPGLNVLVPFAADETPDRYMLNAFAAKPDRARALQAAGLLALAPDSATPTPASLAIDWLLDRPFAAALAGRWRQWLADSTTQDSAREYVSGLASFCAACDPTALPEVRAAALERAYRVLAALVRQTPSLTHLASFIRIAAAMGRRGEAVDTASRLLNDLLRSRPADPLRVPCLAPGATHDTIAPQDDDAAWLLWAVIEYLEGARGYSSYYFPKLIIEDLKKTPDPRFVSVAFLQRVAVVQRRASRPLPPDSGVTRESLREQATALAQQERFAEARDLLLAQPAMIAQDVHANTLLGHVARMAGDGTVARQAYATALALNPAHADASIGLALLLMSGHDYPAARRALEAVTPAQPEYLRARATLAKVAHDLGEHQAALDILDDTLRRAPDNPEMRLARAAVLFAVGRTAESLQAYTATLRRAPDPASLTLALAKQREDEGDHPQARLIVKAGRALAPRSAPLMVRAASLAIDLGDIDDARRLIDLAQSLTPADAQLWHARGLASGYEGDYRQAQEELRKALQMDPAEAGKAWSNLGWLHLTFGQHAAATEAYLRAVGPGNVVVPELQSSFLMSLRCWPAHPADQTFEIFRQWGARAEAAVSKLRADRRALRPPTGRSRIRVGYLSGDFREHSVMYFLEPVLAHHDRQRFEIYGYHLGRKQDAVTARVKTHADHWRNVFGMDLSAMLQLVRNDELDILIDLAGHMQGNHLALFAARAAFVQGTWLGCPGTTGLSQMDFRFVDALTDPPGASDRWHTETLVRLPRVFCVYAPPIGDIAPAAPPSRAAGHITFCSFNNTTKLSDVTLEAWGQVLQAVPGSRLLLKGTGLERPRMQATWRERLATFGIAPERVEFAGKAGTTLQHLADYARIDIALDTTPYNGVTTTCEALWMGVPVVTFWGEEHAGRVAGDLLTVIGHGDLVGQNAADFVRIARDLAGDQERLARLRAGLRAAMQASPLMDYRTFTREVEAAYERVLADTRAALN